MLLDACVVSELWKPQPNLGVVAFIDAADLTETFLSVVTAGELAKGVALLADGRRKHTLARWVMQLEQQFSDRILAIDGDAAHLWGELADRTQSRGMQLPAGDGFIAATALRHGLHVVTRNTNHFAVTGAALLNPRQN